jgi:hypothetical protein
MAEVVDLCGDSDPDTENSVPKMQGAIDLCDDDSSDEEAMAVKKKALEITHLIAPATPFEICCKYS